MNVIEVLLEALFFVLFAFDLCILSCRSCIDAIDNAGDSAIASI